MMEITQDWLKVNTWIEDGSNYLFTKMLGENDLANALAHVIAVLVIDVVVFALILSAMLMILWMERKVLGRLMDRRGAMTTIRSFWVGEYGVTAGAWWDRIPLGFGKPIGVGHDLLHKAVGNRHGLEQVNHLENRSWWGVSWLLPGFVQNLADGMKLFTKEWMVPKKADRVMFEISPIIIISSTVLMLIFIPLGPDIYAANPELSLLFMMALFAIAPFGVFFAGWASNNKYTLLGGIRSAAQLTAYEIPLLLVVLSVAVLNGTFNVVEIVQAQIDSNAWTGFLLPLGGALFIITMLAEVERIPFDMPEAEAELVEGWWTEYGGIRWGLMFAAEYLRVFAACLLGAIFFLGGWETPFVEVVSSLPNIDLAIYAWVGGFALLSLLLRTPPLLLVGLLPAPWLSWVPGLIWLLLKAWGIFFVFAWARAALPRVRTDQILEFGWKWLLPLSVLNLVIAGALRIQYSGEWPEWLPWAMTFGMFALFLLLSNEKGDTSGVRENPRTARREARSTME